MCPNKGFLFFHKKKRQYPLQEQVHPVYRDKYKYTNDIEKAARFLYLNHASFNGIYRVNNSGKYNVPYGKRGIKYNTDIIKRANVLLENTELKTGDFSIWADEINENDLVFLDPPYSVSSNKKENSSFGEFSSNHSD